MNLLASINFPKWIFKVSFVMFCYLGKKKTTGDAQTCEVWNCSGQNTYILQVSKGDTKIIFGCISEGRHCDKDSFVQPWCSCGKCSSSQYLILNVPQFNLEVDVWKGMMVHSLWSFWIASIKPHKTVSDFRAFQNLMKKWTLLMGIQQKDVRSSQAVCRL